MAGPQITHVAATFRGTGVVADISELLFDQRQQGWQPELVSGRRAVADLVEKKQYRVLKLSKFPL